MCYTCVACPRAEIRKLCEKIPVVFKILMVYICLKINVGKRLFRFLKNGLIVYSLVPRCFIAINAKCVLLKQLDISAGMQTIQARLVGIL